MLELIILLLCVITSALIGAFVYLRNPKALINKLYMALTIFFLLFAIANYFSLRSTQRLFFIRMVIFFATLALTTMYFFVSELLSMRIRLRVLTICISYFSAIVVALELTPLVFRGLSSGTNPVPIPGPAAILFLAHFVLVPGIVIGLISFNSHKFSAVQRIQSAYILMGLVPIVLLAPLTSFVLPVVFHNANLIFLSPVYVLFFVMVIGYAIVRHKLFDLRFYVIRATTYLLTFSVLVIFFAVPSIWLTARLLNLHISLLDVSVLAVVSFILNGLYIWLRKIFDRVTYKIFFRQYYVSQDVLDSLSNFLVRTIDLDRVTAGSGKILASALRISSLEYLLEGSKNTDEFMLLGKYFRHKETVVIADELEETMASSLRERDIAAVVRLRTTDGELGYIVLGYKRSGQAYSIQDRRLLSTAADEIAISIQNSLHLQEIQSFNQTLQERIQKATADLSRTNQKLKALDETKDEFITMASHQLRTPLTSVKGYLSMVLEGDVGKLNDQQTKLLTQSYVSSQRMVYLISDLLNLSRLNTGKFVIETAPVQLADVVEAEVSQLSETAHGHGVSLDFDKPADFPELLLDENKIHQVVMNFMDNAVYYTLPGGHITVSLKETPSAVEYRVTDTGIGVPRADQHRLFTKFYRAGNARAARPDGTGLGLFMAKKVIAAQGGAILFNSVEGKGSTFGFRFTKAKHAPGMVEATKTTVT